MPPPTKCSLHHPASWQHPEAGPRNDLAAVNDGIFGRLDMRDFLWMANDVRGPAQNLFGPVRSFTLAVVPGIEPQAVQPREHEMDAVEQQVNPVP